MMLQISFDPSLLAYLTPQELADLDALIASDPTPCGARSGDCNDGLRDEADIIG